MPNGYKVHFNDGKSTYSKNDDFRTFIPKSEHKTLKTYSHILQQSMAVKTGPVTGRVVTD